jgi:hypothetical protein
MNYSDLALDERTFDTVPAPFNILCARSTCQTYIRPGEPTKRYDAATFEHVNHPSTPLRTFAAHKNPDFK